MYFKEMWGLAIQGQTQGVLFWAALYTFIACTYSTLFQVRTRYWPHVQGELVEFGINKFGATEMVKSNQDYVGEALYTYNVSGVVYEGTRISPWIFVANHNAKFILKKQMSSVQLSPEGKVNVYYNPNNPKKSFLIVAGKIGVCITLLISILPLMLFYFKYYM